MSSQGHSVPTVASTSWFEQQFDALKARAIVLWVQLEGDIQAVAAKLLPEIEVDIESALESFGEALVGDAIGLLASGSPIGATVSAIVTSLIQKVEAQGKSIGLATASTAAQQITGAALSGLKQVASQTSTVSAAH